MREVERRIEAAKAQAVRRRNYRRARDRALVKLANLYREEYWDLLEEEKRADEEGNKKWLDISGRTRTTGSRRK
jgi:hypothetical protein